MKKQLKKLSFCLAGLLLLLSFTSCSCKHENCTEATCIAPKTCVDCNKEFGEPSFEHSWNKATCLAPETCSVCGEKRGEISLEHSWIDADCENPKTCSVCGLTEGMPEHDFDPADCTNPEICKKCGAIGSDALGHDFADGICTRCSYKDPNYVKTYSVGETWVVEDQWEFTVNSVTSHHRCNSLCDDPGQQVIIIDYTYKNLGYQGSSQDLYMSSSSMDVYDGSNQSADRYPCTHTKNAKVCIVGTWCNASASFILHNTSSEITLVVEDYTSNDTGKQKATFKLNVN